MIVDTKRDVESNITNSKEFSITKNAVKIFSALGNFLYSNKEKAVLHEISANAIDAHKLAGIEDTPISVTCPTTFDPFLRIRDFGPGLDDANIFLLMSGYGESTKNQNNDFVGGWGIGSKSPASVTDTWNITSHHAGLKTNYVIFINGDGVPSITRINSVPTDETGIEVAIPIPSEKFRVWINLIQTDVYTFYSVKPDVFHNGCKFTFSEIVRGTQITDFAYFSETNSYGQGAAITSNRVYTIDWTKVFDGVVGAHATFVQGLVIEFPIGELELSLSRETIQYTSKSINAIRHRVALINDAFDKLFNDFVGEPVNQLDFILKVNGFTKSIKGISDYNKNNHAFRNMICSANKGRYGLNSSNYSEILSSITFPAVKESNYFGIRNGKLIRDVRYSTMIGGHVKVAYSRNPTTHVLDVIDSKTCVLAAGYIEEYILAHNDVKFAQATAKRLSESDSSKRILVGDFSNVPEFLKHLVMNLSSVPKAAKVVGQVSQKIEKDFVYVLRWSSRRSFDRCLVSDLNLAECVWVKTSSFASFYSSASIDQLSTYYPDVRVIGVKDEKDVPTGVLSVEEFLKRKYLQIISTKEFKTDVESSKKIFIASSVPFQFKKYATLRTQGDSLWNEFFTKNSMTTKFIDRDKYDIAISLAMTLGLPSPSGASTSDHSEIDALVEKYAILKFIHGANESDVLQYLNQVGSGS